MSPEELLIIQDLLDRIKRIDSKVDDLLAFKWKIYGATAVISIICAAIIQFGVARYEKGHKINSDMKKSDLNAKIQ